MTAKRCLDIAVAFVALLVLAPFMVAIAIAVRLSSPGPVLFRQVRVGRGGRNFEILKFRTMRTEASPGRLITVDGDSRVTDVGSSLRKTKLDELPQFINVLVGDMSLVGPRPEVPKYVALYPKEVRDVILSVRPGITDNASVEFRNEGELLARAADPEAAYVGEILPRKLKLYCEYVTTWSMAGDFRILWRTLIAVLKG